MKFTTQVQTKETERELVEIRLTRGHGASLVWAYPDDSLRVVQIGQSVATEFEEFKERYAPRGNAPLVAGALTGKRIRVREGTRVNPPFEEDDFFDCDAESRSAGDKDEDWVICALGIQAGTTGTIGGIDAGDSYEVIWDDGRRDGADFSEARGCYPEAQILAGAEVIG